MVLAGTRLDFRMKYGASIPADAQIVQLDLDDTLIGQNRSADIGLVENLGVNLDPLTDALNGSLDFSKHTAHLRTVEDAADAALAAQLHSDEMPIDPMRLCHEIADFGAADNEMIVIGDGGDIVAQASKILRVPPNGT